LGIIIDVNALHEENTKLSIVASVEVGVNVTDVNPHPWNAPVPILVTELPIVTDVNALHESNAKAPILVTELGIVTDVNALHPLNALLPIVASVEVGVNVKVVNALHPRNEAVTILVTELPIVTLVKLAAPGTIIAGVEDDVIPV
jgi:hypothetical protein